MNENLAVRAIQDWRRFPELGRVFESVTDYADYLSCDFNTLVNRYQKGSKCSYAEAVRAIAHNFPEIHQKFIAVSNIIKPVVTNKKTGVRP